MSAMNGLHTDRAVGRIRAFKARHGLTCADLGRLTGFRATIFADLDNPDVRAWTVTVRTLLDVEAVVAGFECHAKESEAVRNKLLLLKQGSPKRKHEAITKKSTSNRLGETLGLPSFSEEAA